MVRRQPLVVGKIKTLIFGAGGMLGTDLRAVFPDAVALTHQEIDVTDRSAVMEVVIDAMPDVVINAAAYTNVDGCEDERERAWDVNGRAPGYMAEACRAAKATLVHYSTDYVFDGCKSQYFEDDRPDPLSVYGQSKLAGERNIASGTDDYRIIRSSWLFGAHGRNFVDTMLSLSRQMDTVRVVNDQFGKPTCTVDLAKKTVEVIGLPPGIYHVTNEGACSWYEFASAIIPNVTPCTTAEYPRKARRPKCSVLMNTKTTPVRHWREALRDYLAGKGERR